MTQPYIPDDGLDDDDVQGGAPPPVPADLHEVPGAASRDELAALFEQENANPSPPAPAAPAPGAAPGAAAPMGAPAAPAAGDEEDEISKLIAARNANQGVRDDAKAQADRIIAEATARARAEAERIVAEATARAQAQQDALLNGFQTKPVETFQSLKVDPKKFIQDVADLDDPRAQELRQLRQQVAEIPKLYEERFKKYDEVLSQGQQRIQAEQQLAQQRAQRDTEAEWVSTVQKELPHMWEHAQREADLRSSLGYPVTPEQVLVRQGHEIGLAMSDIITPPEDLAAGKRRFAPVPTMVHHLKRQHLAKAGAAGGAPGGAPQPTTRASGNGSRTLSSPTASERRTTPRAPTPDDPDVRDAAAAAFDEAMREESAKARR